MTPRDTLELNIVAPRVGNVTTSPRFTQLECKRTEFISLINETFSSNAQVSRILSVTTDKYDLTLTSCNAKCRTHVGVFTIAVCEGRMGGQVGKCNEPTEVVRWRAGRHVRVAHIEEKMVGSPIPSYTSSCVGDDTSEGSIFWLSNTEGGRKSLQHA